MHAEDAVNSGILTRLFELSARYITGPDHFPPNQITPCSGWNMLSDGNRKTASSLKSIIGYLGLLGFEEIDIVAFPLGPLPRFG